MQGQIPHVYTPNVKAWASNQKLDGLECLPYKQAAEEEADNGEISVLVGHCLMRVCTMCFLSSNLQLLLPKDLQH